MEDERYRRIMKKTAAELQLTPEELEKSFEEMLAQLWERPNALKCLRVFGFPGGDVPLSVRELVEELYQQSLQDGCEPEEPEELEEEE